MSPHSIHISYSGARHFTQVQKAIILGNNLLQSDEFYGLIAAHPSFDLSDIPPVMIADLMRSTHLSISVTLYYSLSPIKHYDGYDDLDNPSIIHLNAWKIERTPASICNTIIHGIVHAVNAKHPEYSFGHGDMSSNGKGNTAPYWIGRLAQRIVTHDNNTFTSLEHDRYEPMVKDIRRYLS